MFFKARGRRGPILSHRAQDAKEFGNLRNGYAHLAARITLAHGDGAVSDGTVIDCDGERDAELIGTRIALPDGNGGGVKLGADAVRRQ